MYFGGSSAMGWDGIPMKAMRISKNLTGLTSKKIWPKVYSVYTVQNNMVFVIERYFNK